MDQKSANELRCRKIHSFSTVGITAVFVRKNHSSAFDVLDPVIANSNPVCISTKIGKNLFWSRKRFFSVNDPIFIPSSFQKILTISRESETMESALHQVKIAFLELFG